MSQHKSSTRSSNTNIEVTDTKSVKCCDGGIKSVTTISPTDNKIVFDVYDMYESADYRQCIEFPNAFPGKRFRLIHLYAAMSLCIPEALWSMVLTKGQLVHVLPPSPEYQRYIIAHVSEFHHPNDPSVTCHYEIYDPSSEKIYLQSLRLSLRSRWNSIRIPFDGKKIVVGARVMCSLSYGRVGFGTVIDLPNTIALDDPRSQIVTSNRFVIFHSSNVWKLAPARLSTALSYDRGTSFGFNTCYDARASYETVEPLMPLLSNEICNSLALFDQKDIYLRRQLLIRAGATSTQSVDIDFYWADFNAWIHGKLYLSSDDTVHIHQTSLRGSEYRESFNLNTRPRILLRIRLRDSVGITIKPWQHLKSALTNRKPICPLDILYPVPAQWFVNLLKWLESSDSSQPFASFSFKIDGYGGRFPFSSPQVLIDEKLHDVLRYYFQMHQEDLMWQSLSYETDVRCYAQVTPFAEIVDEPTLIVDVSDILFRSFQVIRTELEGSLKELRFSK